MHDIGESGGARTEIITECSAAARRWLEAGNGIQIWAWSKKGPRGKRKTWQVTITEITIEEFRPRRKEGVCGQRRPISGENPGGRRRPATVIAPA